MTKDPEKIREQIDKLQDDLKQAEQEKRDKNRKKITRAAERSGLDKLTLSTAEIESQFKQIVRQKRESEAAKPAQDKPANSQSGKEVEASADTETAQTSSNTGDTSTLKKPVDSQQQSEPKSDAKPEQEQHRRNPFRR